jgi:MOB kinase activator 1
MSAGPKFQYLWADGVKVKTPTNVSAPDYVDLLMSWVESQLNDEQLFPLQFGTPFPRNFLAIVKTIYKRLFRVYAHIYYLHYENIQQLGAEAHLNSCFKHFILFVEEFDLIEDKELAPLEEVIQKLLNKDGSQPSKTKASNVEEEEETEDTATEAKQASESSK